MNMKEMLEQVKQVATNNGLRVIVRSDHLTYQILELAHPQNDDVFAIVRVTAYVSDLDQMHYHLAKRWEREIIKSTDSAKFSAEFVQFIIDIRNTILFEPTVYDLVCTERSSHEISYLGQTKNETLLSFSVNNRKLYQAREQYDE